MDWTCRHGIQCTAPARSLAGAGSRGDRLRAGAIDVLWSRQPRVVGLAATLRTDWGLERICQAFRRSAARSVESVGARSCAAGALAVLVALCLFVALPAAQGAVLVSSRAFSTFKLPTANAFPQEITAGHDGNLWFTEAGANKIGRITPSGAISEFAIPRTPARRPVRDHGRARRQPLVHRQKAQPTRSGGSPRAARSASSRSPRRSGVVRDRSCSRRRPLVHGDAREQDRTDDSKRRDQRVPVPTPDSLPNRITAGPEGDVWSTEQRSARSDGSHRLAKSVSF